MDFILHHNLSFFNDGSITFHNVLRSEVLDVTLGNPSASTMVSQWHTSPIPSLSDHALIRFTITALGKPTQSFLPDNHRRRTTKLSTTEYGIFKENLSELVTSHSKALSLPCNTAFSLHDKVDLVSSLIYKAFKSSKTFNYVSFNTFRKKLHSPWWSKELSSARAAARRCWNRFRRTYAQTDLASYKKANNKYLKMIKHNKNHSWREYCSNTSSSLSKSSKLIKSLKHKKTTLSSIKKRDGTFTESIKETLDASTSKDNLSSIPISHSLLLPSTPPVSTSQPDEDLAATICSEKRIEKAFSLLNPNKALGPDNISNKLLSHAWPLLKPTFTQIF